MASEKVGSIHYDLSMKTEEFDKGVENVNNRLASLRPNFAKATESSKKLAMALGGFALAGVGLLGKGVKILAELETIEAGLKGVLGSSEEASNAMKRIKKEASRTPFEIAGLSQATRMLSVVTGDGDKAIDMVLDVGEAITAVGGGQAELDRVIANIQQIGAVGKASSMDIKQFAFAGIPIYKMLEKQTGKSGEALQKYIRDGKVSFGTLKKMFKNATDQGGQFAGAFESMGGTFDQTWSNMQDSLSIFLSDFVESSGIFDGVKDAIQGVTDFLTRISEEAEKAGGWGEYLKQKFEELREPILIIGGAIAFALLPFIWSLVAGMWALVAPLLPFLAIGAAIGFLISKLADHFGGFGEMIESLKGTVKDWKNKFRSVVDWLKEAGRKIGEIFTKVKDAIQKPIEDAINWVLDRIREVLKWIDEQIKRVTKFFEDAGKTMRTITGEAQKEAGARTGDVEAQLASRGLTREQLSQQSRQVSGVKEPQQNTNVTINMSGVMASGKTDLRKVGGMLAQAFKDTQTAKNIR